MRVLRTILRVFGWVPVVLTGLVIVVFGLIYFPPFQQLAIGQAEKILAEKTGLVVSVDRFRVRFPLGVSLRDTEVVMPSGDTLLRVERLSTNISASLRRLKDHQIVVRRVTLAGADVRLGVLLADTTFLASFPSSDSVASSAGTPWSVEVRRLDVSRSRVSLDSPDILVDSLQLSVRDFLYAGSDISVRLRQLAFVERISGLRLKEAKGEVAMKLSDDSPGHPDSAQKGYFAVHDFSLTTDRSHLLADARVGEGIVRLDDTTPVTLSVSGSVTAVEWLPFLPLDAELKSIIAPEKLTLAGSFSGSLDDLAIEHLTASLAGPTPQIDLKASGRVRSVLDPAKMSGSVTLDGRFADLEFAKAFLPDTALRRRVSFPRDMTLRAVADFSSEKYDVQELTLVADSGRLEVKGSFAPHTETYDGNLRLRRFPLGGFLPQDSLGTATLALVARGRGFDPFGGMAVWVGLGVTHLYYKDVDYSNIRLMARLARGRFDVDAAAQNSALGFEIEADGTLQGDMAAKRYDVTAAIARTMVRVDSMAFRLDSTNLHFASRPGRTAAEVHTGDLALELTSPLSLDSLATGFGRMGSEVQRQLRARHFSADSLQSAFPAVRLVASAGRANLLHEFAELNGLTFRSFEADVSTLEGAPFSIEAKVRGLGTGKFTLDTLDFDAHRNANRLDYALRVANRPGNNDQLGLVKVSGSAAGNGLSVDLEQRNRADSVGFRFGVDVSLTGETLHAEVTPSEPIFAYQPWSVGGGSGAGGGDWIEWDTDGAMRADLYLTGPRTDEFVNITSASLPDIPDGALALAIEGLDIDAMMDLFPGTPPVGGKLMSNLTFGFREGIIAAKGTLGVSDLTYSERRVATVDADVDFQSRADGRMVLSAGVKLDEDQALTASGYYTAEDMDFTLAIPQLPLSVADGFIPPETATLKGSLDGTLRIAGLPTDPALSGDVGFTDAAIDVLMTGTTLRISPDRVTIADGRVTLGGLGIIDQGNRKLALTGSVDISDRKNPVADLALSTSGFRVVDSQHIGGSQVYGTAAFDASVTARGGLSSMLVRGSVDVLQNTNVFYILRNTSRVRDEKQHIVEFRDFAADSMNLALGTATRTLAPLQPRVDVLVNVDIADGVRATLSLDELSENRVALLGSGALSYSMNTQGDMRLSGRYTLSDGQIYYKPPMIGQKIFAVSDGSYVEWTGEALDPEFHVTATQTSGIELTYDDGLSEEVDFDISIDVQGSLSGIDMRFDVAAPDNLAIQNQLLSMSTEERMRQALMLLISGHYNGPGVSSKSGTSFDARKQIGDFISKEVNQWARNNLKGVDFQMGIASHNDAAGGTSTDYTYSVSKSLASDRVKITIGGSVNDSAGSEDFAQNLLGDLELEYRLTERDNMFAKIYRTTARESILEGEVTETGGGFMLRKKINKLKDLFRRRQKNETK